MYEAPIRPTVMNDLQRREFVQKAKADRLAFEAAELLSNGETGKAAALVGKSMTTAGRQQLATWFRHYATTRFKIAGRIVDEFLGGVTPADVAL